MKDFLLTAVGFIVFIVFLGFALWLGAAIILIVGISTVILIATLYLRIYYLRWKYNRVFKATDVGNSPKAEPYNPYNHQNNQHNQQSGATTIIDVEYQEISDKK